MVAAGDKASYRRYHVFTLSTATVEEVHLMSRVNVFQVRQRTLESLGRLDGAISHH